jgi:2-isopropylmalate synthase
MTHCYVFDTTLRDGEQSPGASLEIHEKLQIARALENLGVDYIETGFPIASQKDFEAARQIAAEITNPTITTLARCLPKDIEAAAKAIETAKKGQIHLFLATSANHRKHKFQRNEAQLLEITKNSVAQAGALCDNILFSPEDATRTEQSFLVDILGTAINAGATEINIPDTVGYTTPAAYGNLIAYLKKQIPELENMRLHVHCHNDLGLATANSVQSIIDGANVVQTTINGIGERAGNAALEEVVMALHTKNIATTNIKTQQLCDISHLVSSLTRMVVQDNKAVVGKNAFAHKSGIHQHGVLAEKSTYEVMKAEDVGQKSSIVLGRLSGRHAYRHRIKELRITANELELERGLHRFTTNVGIVADDVDVIASVWDEQPQPYIVQGYSVQKEKDQTRVVIEVCCAMHTYTLRSSADNLKDAVIRAFFQDYDIEPTSVEFESNNCRIQYDGILAKGSCDHEDPMHAYIQRYATAIKRIAFGIEFPKRE